MNIVDIVNVVNVVNVIKVVDMIEPIKDAKPNQVWYRCLDKQMMSDLIKFNINILINKWY